MSCEERILPIINKMEPITLEEMDSIKLMNRIDTKFVTSEDMLVNILSDALEKGYRACEILGQRVTGYNSLYYDTASLSMYIAHHNGRKVRQKVRVRNYQVNNLTFLEIKQKNNKGRTKKKRIQVGGDCYEDFSKDAEAAQFLADNSWFTVDVLSPECTTEFRRITLVNAAKTERLTIDTSLHFRNYRTGRSASLANAVIIELKQDGRIPSQMRQILLQRRVHPFRISKYCIGTALTHTNVKANRFKKKIRAIEKIINCKIV